MMMVSNDGMQGASSSWHEDNVVNPHDPRDVPSTPPAQPPAARRVSSPPGRRPRLLVYGPRRPSEEERRCALGGRARIPRPRWLCLWRPPPRRPPEEAAQGGCPRTMHLRGPRANEASTKRGHHQTRPALRGRRQRGRRRGADVNGTDFNGTDVTGADVNGSDRISHDVRSDAIHVISCDISSDLIRSHIMQI